MRKAIKLHYLEDLRAQMTLAGKLWIALAQLFPRRVISAADPEQPAVVLFTTSTEWCCRTGRYWPTSRRFAR